MTTIARNTLTLIGVLAALLLPSAALAQVTVTARLSPQRVYVGDAAQLSIEVNGSKAPDRPLIPDVPGLEIAFAGGQDSSRHSIMIVNGKRTEQSFEGYVFSYRVAPIQPGRFTIPPITVTADGKQYTTQPVVMNAIEAGEIDGFRLVMETDKTHAYVGEPVKVRFTLYITQDVNPQRLTIPEGDQFQILPAPAPDVQGRPIKLFDQPAVQSRAELDGVPCVTATTDRYFVARESGTIKLGPSRIVMDVGDSFFGRPQRHVIASNSLEFDVKPLPTPQPPGFNNLFGEHRVETRASATDMHVGDPITLTVTVYGPEPLDVVPPMDFSQQPGFTGAFRTSAEPIIPSLATGAAGRAAVFTTTIRAESDDIREIPAIELPYFDPAKNAYGVARSKPIPIKVHPTTEVGLPADLADAGAASAPKDESVGGLAPIIASPAVLTQTDFNLMRTLRSPAAAGLLAAPALIYFASAGLIAVRRHSERDPARRRRRAAAGRARRRLARAARRSAGPEEIGAALRGFVADWFDMPEAGATSAECSARLKDLNADAASTYSALLDRCDSALYGGASATASIGEAQQLVRTLAQELEAKR